MDLISRILECKSDEDVDKIITEEIDKIQGSVQPVELLGVGDYSKFTKPHKGFIPLNTRIKYDNFCIGTYGMETTDFFYDFAHFIRKHNIHNKIMLVNCIHYFIVEYFGPPGKYHRDDFFDPIFTGKTTEEVFAEIKNYNIGNLKGKGAAECTEYSALAQQLLSLFDIESYYCLGCADCYNKQEGHCFNVAKGKNSYILLDYSIPIGIYNNDGTYVISHPFMGELSEEEFIDFLKNGTIKEFDDYKYIGSEKQLTNSKRKYIVGVNSFDKGKKM